MKTYGNTLCQSSLQEALSGLTGTVALTGPAHLGKASFSRHMLSSSLSASDFLDMEPGVDGVRAALSFLSTEPVHGRVKALLVDDADRLGEPAQDALLKVVEEPPPSCLIFLVAHDPGLLQPALVSRLRRISRWLPLPADEMRAFADSMMMSVSEQALSWSCGLPGVYTAMVENSGFDELFSMLSRAGRGESLLLAPVPDVVSKLETGPGLVRDAVVHLVRRASRSAGSPSAAVKFLKFATTLSSSPSANAEIHWSRMVVSLASVMSEPCLP